MLSKFLHHKPEGKDVVRRTDGSKSGSSDDADSVGNSNGRPSHKSPTSPRGDFLPLEDIYRAAGIISLQTKFGIDKVVEMLNSNHIRDLSNDLKRASVLMALDVAGASINEVLNDAKRRLDAIDFYEADQKRHFEAYEAEKVQENAAIQLELERVTAHYLGRVKRNQDEVMDLKQQFANWQTMKQQEARRISQAVDVCETRVTWEPASDSPTEGAPAKPAMVSDTVRAAEESAKAKSTAA